MKKRLENPELDQLVAELNTPSDRAAENATLGPARLDAVESAEDRPPLGARRVDVLEGPLARILERMVSQGASDLLLVAGRPPVLRIDGDLVVTDEAAATAVQLEERFAPFLGPRHLRDLERRGAADFTIRLALSSGEQWRFRVNLHRQSGQPAAAVRALAQRIPTLEELDLPPEIHELAELRQGLLLVCGPTGAGKSSTLAALVGIINRRRRAHVIAIEDPLEFVHRDVRCLIEHVEIGHDAPSYAEALRAALRQDPDVILVGEMRDLETIATAVTAAETGHLILSTLHSPDSVQAIHRMVDVFPAEAKTQVRHQLALSLRAILAQELVPRLDGRGRVPAVELLKATHAVRHLIRSEKLDRLYNELVLGRRHGMLTFEQSLADLVRTSIIGEEEARLRARRPELHAVPESVRELEALGYDGVLTTETSHDPFFPLLLAAEHSERVQLITSIAVAFARNPMTVASIAHDLNAYSGGRFVLGLGSQIKPHITKRFSMPWSKPAARMREFVEALRAVWASWYDGEPLAFRGEFYTHTLMTPNFTPRDVEHGPPPVILAAVGPLMTRTAGEVADGMIAHRFTTERYLREVTLPTLEQALASSGRSRADFTLSYPAFIVSGANEDQFAANKAAVRKHIAFYGSTPAYRPVLELHGWGELQDELNAMSKRGLWDEMAHLIDDEILDAFAVVGEPEEIVPRLESRFGSLVDRITADFDFVPRNRRSELVEALRG